MTDNADDPSWLRMERHVALLLRTHPSLEGLMVVVSANEHAIDAAVEGDGVSVGARLESEGWWEPDVPDRGEEIADELAEVLWERWLAKRPQP